MVGRELTASELDELAKAIQVSSVPAVIAHLLNGTERTQAEPAEVRT